MKRTFLIGIAAAVIGGLGLFIASALGMTFQNTIIGVGCGVIIAIVPIGSPVARLGGLLIGFALGIFFSAMQLGLLPGGASVAGSAVALAVVMIVIALISGFTSDRVAAWCMLLGALAFVAGFLPTAETTPWTASDDLPSSVFSLLAMALIGFLTIVPAELLGKGKAAAAAPKAPPSQPTPDESPTEVTPTPDVSLNEIIGGAR